MNETDEHAPTRTPGKFQNEDEGKILKDYKAK